MRLGGRISLWIDLKDKKLRLDPRHHFVPELLGLRDLALQGLTGTSGEGRSVGVVDVADHPRDLPALVVVGQDPERLDVRLEHHVRLFDANEPLDRGAVEHDVALERLLELALGDLDVLVDAQDVGELQAQERHALFLGELEDIALGGHGRRNGGKTERR